MKATLLSLHAGQTGKIIFNITAPEGADTTLIGALLVNGKSVLMDTSTPGRAYVPPVEVGCHFYEIRCGGATVLHGELDVTPSALGDVPGEVVWEVDADLTQPLAVVNIVQNPGPAGRDGRDGQSAYELWLAAGNTGSVEDFLDSLKGDPGQDGQAGKDGEAPSVEDVAAALLPMISAELAYEGPAATANWHASYFQLGEAYLPQGTALYEFGYRVRFDSMNGCTTDPVYLGIWERSEDGEDWELRGISLNTQVQAQSADVLWRFDPANVRLSGRPIRCCLMATRDDGWRTDLTMGMRVSNVTGANTAIFYNEQSWTMAPKYFMRGYKPVESIGLGGKPGADGLSAYELAVQQGYAGSLDDWLASLKGEKGDPGQDGAPGPQGPKGVDAVVEQAYNATSENAMSGKAVAAALKTVTGGMSIAFGSLANNSGSLSIAIGYDARATNEQAVAIGTWSRGWGDNSVSIGHQSAAEGYKSTTIGAFAEANGDFSFSFGYKAKASAGEGDMSVRAADDGEKALHFTLIAPGCAASTQHLDGEAGLAYSIGDEGTRTYKKMTDLFAQKGNSVDGINITADATAVGTNAQATGALSIAVGRNATAKGSASFAIGTGASSESCEGVLRVGGMTAISTEIKILSPISTDSINKLGGKPGLAYRCGSGSYSYLSLSDLFDFFKIRDNADSVRLGTDANVSGNEAVAVGSYTEAQEGSVTIGCGAQSGSWGVSVGYNATSGTGGFSIGAYAQTHAKGIGLLSVQTTPGSGNSTSLYLIAEGSPTSESYLNGQAGLGFISRGEGGKINSRGCIPLSQLCTQHAQDFSLVE